MRPSVGRRPSQRCAALANAYLSFCQANPSYFRLIMAFDRGRFEESISPRTVPGGAGQEPAGDWTWWPRPSSMGKASGEFRVDDPWQAAGSVWAALNGVLVLMAHPLRRQMLQSDLATMFQATLDLVVRRLKEVGQAGYPPQRRKTHERSRHCRGRADPHRQPRRRVPHADGAAPGRPGLQGGHRPGGHRSQPVRRRDPGLHRPAERRAQHRPGGGAAGRRAGPRARLHGAAQLRLGHAVHHLRLPGHPGRRWRGVSVRRRREHEHLALRGARRALGPQAAPRHLCRHPVGGPDRPGLRPDDGLHRREPGHDVQHQPRAAGQVCR